MSTYLRIECLDHDPPIVAEDESGQHLYDLPDIRAAIARRDVYSRIHRDDNDLYWDLLNGSDYFVRNSMRFLVQHPTCRLGIRDEYGRTHPIEPEAVGE